MWQITKLHKHIQADTVVLCDMAEDSEWIDMAMKYLPYYMQRMKARRYVIIDDKLSNHIIKYYRLNRFSDRIVFLKKRVEGLWDMSRVVEGHYASLEEIICLGYFHLREVPDNV